MHVNLRIISVTVSQIINGGLAYCPWCRCRTLWECRILYKCSRLWSEI